MNSTLPGEKEMLFISCYPITRTGRMMGIRNFFEKLKQDARNKFPDDKRFKRIGY